MDSLKSNEQKNKEDSESIKVILIGDSGTGKTSLIAISAGNVFDSSMVSTTSFSFIKTKIIINKKEYNLDIWDTIGQEKFRSMTQLFVKESKIVILVYDITKRVSFESLSFWKKMIDNMIKDSPVIGIVGNKIDLYEQEQVHEKELSEYAKSLGVKYLITSAKNDNISFSKFLEELLYDYLKKSAGGRLESFSLEEATIAKKEKKNCC